MRLPLLIGAILSATALSAAAVSLAWTPYDIAALAIADKLQPPSAAHWFGTDHFGRDIGSMLMAGAQTSIAVALVAVGIGMGLGVPLGLLAAANRGGLIDEAVMRANDLVFAFPSLVIAIRVTSSGCPPGFESVIVVASVPPRP